MQLHYDKHSAALKRMGIPSYLNSIFLCVRQCFEKSLFTFSNYLHFSALYTHFVYYLRSKLFSRFHDIKTSNIYPKLYRETVCWTGLEQLITEGGTRGKGENSAGMETRGSPRASNSILQNQWKTFNK